MIRYPGNVPSNVNRDAKYRVKRSAEGWLIQLVYRLSLGEQALVTTSAHPDLVDMVNAAKEEGSDGSQGGQFYINEYHHVLVPTDEGCLYAGRYSELLRFKFEALEITPEAPPGIKPGDEWQGPRVGIAYVLSADGADIRYRVETRPNVLADRRLSAEVGNVAAKRTARRLYRHKPGGGRIYVNEARECFAPLGDALCHTYLGPIDLEEWFAEPAV